MKLVSIIIFLFMVVSSMAQPAKFDIATFTQPKGWGRIDSNGVVLLHDSKTINGLTSFCQIFLFPSRASNGSPEENFEMEWNARVAQTTGTKEIPKMESEKTPDGWTVLSGHANITQQGITYTCMLVAISGFNKVMSVVFNLAGEEYLSDVDNFLKNLDLDGHAQGSIPAGGSTTGLNDYSFIPPARWFRQNSTGNILLSQYQTLQYGCLITIFPPQPSSGNLEADAKSIFSQMYPGWQFRYTGEKQNDISKGYTPQGLEYCIMEASMHKMRPDGYYYDYEDGAAVVIHLGNQIAVITGRHSRGEMTCFCKHQYEYWGKFFNSFTIKNQASSKNAEADVSKRMLGSWESMGGSALVKYVFAANGNYQFIGAYSTTTRISWNTIEMKTSGFKGDGSYAIKGNQLVFTKYGGKPDISFFRLERVNHGSTGWKDRLYILNVSEDGKEYEVSYEKEEK